MPNAARIGRESTNIPRRFAQTREIFSHDMLQGISSKMNVPHPIAAVELNLQLEC